MFRCRECHMLLVDVTSEEDAICGRCIDKCLSDELDSEVADIPKQSLEKSPEKRVALNPKFQLMNEQDERRKRRL